jgi:hypothetical protein
MKWIKPRNKFLNEEAKIKDLILPRQAREVKRVWGEQYLELEEVKPTENIKQGKWELSDEDKIHVLSMFFGANLKNVYDFFGSLPDKFNDIIKQSINLDLLKSDDKWSKILDNFDIKKPSINQISVLTDPIFRKISVSETTSSEIIIRDETGRPVMDESTNRPKKRRREEGEIIFSNNLVNINTFVADYNGLVSRNIIMGETTQIDPTRFSSGEIQRLVSSSREDFGGDNYRVEVDLYARKLYLKIDHNPKDIFNMSISRFYSSCQHLYSGGYRQKVIGNVFDPNSIPAFLVFDTPIYNRDNELIAEQLPLSRMMIRNIESWDSKKSPTIFFDRAYPDRMQSIMSEMIEKYSDNKQTSKGDAAYLFTPDIPTDLSIQDPYMDRLSLERGNYIGVNVDKLYLNQSYDWSRTKISPKANIKEIVIETVNVPKNLFEIPITPDWIKIKFIDIKDFSVFSKIKTNSFAFDKCKMNGSIIEQAKKINPTLNKLQIIACEVKDMNLSILGELDELHLVYTIDPSNLESALSGLTVKKLVVSGDLMSDSTSKKVINSLKSKGVKVDVVGPVI